MAVVAFATLQTTGKFVSRTLCIANQKGGVGKTTTSINVATGLANAGNSVLLIDMDPQCNATSGLGLAPMDQHPLISESPFRHSVLASRVNGLDVLPGSGSFRDADALANSNSRATRTVVKHIREGAAAYDFVILDCPPSLGTLTRAALSASKEVLLPIQCEYFAMEGLTQMISVIREVMLERPGELTFGGIVLTMYDESLELTGEVDADLRQFFGEVVFDTVIPRDVHVAEAPSHGQSVLDYAPRSRGSRAYTELCMEILERD